MKPDTTMTTSIVEKKEDPVRVLLVEDESHIRTSLANFLKDAGFDVLSAESAEEALEVITEKTVDVVIVDIRLPKMDGNHLIMRAHQIQSGMQFLIYTGSVTYTLPPSIEKLGMNPEDIFYKPLPDLSLITEAIQRKMQKRYSQDER